MSTTLSRQTIDTVKATIPFLAENGLKLTEHFYQRLFTSNPEVKALFNTSNQESQKLKRLNGKLLYSCRHKDLKSRESLPFTKTLERQYTHDVSR